MGDSILKGISAALVVTVVTLLAGLIWTALEMGGLSAATLVDIGLIASCIAAGYVTGRASGQWLLGGVSGLGYVLLCVVLVALFLELRAWGVIQVLAEGGLLGILSGAFGAGSGGKTSRPAPWRQPRVSSWGNSYSRGVYSSGETYRGAYDYSRAYADKDDHENDWDDLLEEDGEAPYEEPAVKGNKAGRKSLRGERQKSDMDLWEEEQEWSGSKKLSGQQGLSFDRQAGSSDEDEWEDWQRGARNKAPVNYRKAWWEEEVL